jgi:hypothetical protein
MACVHLARRDSQRGTAERVAGGAYLARSIPGWCREGVVGVGAEEAGEHIRDGDGADLARSLGLRCVSFGSGASPCVSFGSGGDGGGGDRLGFAMPMGRAANRYRGRFTPGEYSIRPGIHRG